MAEILFRGHEIPDSLLENFDIRKTLVPFPAPDQFVPAGNPKATGFRPARAQANLIDFQFEGRQDFLSHPRGPEEPAASGAIFYDDIGFFHLNLGGFFLLSSLFDEAFGR